MTPSSKGREGCIACKIMPACHPSSVGRSWFSPHYSPSPHRRDSARDAARREREALFTGPSQLAVLSPLLLLCPASFLGLNPSSAVFFLALWPWVSPCHFPLAEEHPPSRGLMKASSVNVPGPRVVYSLGLKGWKGQSWGVGGRLLWAGPEMSGQQRGLLNFTSPSWIIHDKQNGWARLGRSLLLAGEGRKVSNYRSAAWLRGPWALHTGGIYGKRGERRGSVPAPFRRNSAPLKTVAWTCQGLGRDWGKKLTQNGQEEKTLPRGRRRDVSRKTAGQGGNTLLHVPWRVWPSWVPKGGCSDPKRTGRLSATLRFPHLQNAEKHRTYFTA